MRIVAEFPGYEGLAGPRNFDSRCPGHWGLAIADGIGCPSGLAGPEVRMHPKTVIRSVFRTGHFLTCSVPSAGVVWPPWASRST